MINIEANKWRERKGLRPKNAAINESDSSIDTKNFSSSFKNIRATDASNNSKRMRPITIMVKGNKIGKEEKEIKN